MNDFYETHKNGFTLEEYTDHLEEMCEVKRYKKPMKDKKGKKIREAQKLWDGFASLCAWIMLLGMAIVMCSLMYRYGKQ